MTIERNMTTRGSEPREPSPTRSWIGHTTFVEESIFAEWRATGGDLRLKGAMVL